MKVKAKASRLGKKVIFALILSILFLTTIKSLSSQDEINNQQSQLSIQTDKTQYVIGETVNVSVTVPDINNYKLYYEYNNFTMRYMGDYTQFSFEPLGIGTHYLILRDKGNNELVRYSFEVVEGEQPVTEEQPTAEEQPAIEEQVAVTPPQLITPAAGIRFVLENDTKTKVTQKIQKGIRKILIGIGSAGNYTGILNINFTQNIDMSALVTNRTSTKSVMHNTAPISQLVNRSLLIPRTANTGKVYVCPSAATLEDVKSSCSGRLYIETGQTINGMTVSEVSYDGENYYQVDNVTGSGGGEAGSGWANASFDVCKNITISNSGSETLVDFPAYINLTYDSDMQPNFVDIRFYDTSCDNNGSQLDYEIENYTTSTNAHIWVRIPALSTPNTTISVYYKNNTAVSSGENPTGVWDQYYKAVWHMQRVNATDSTSNANNGNQSGGVVQNASGMIDGADLFDGDDDYVELGTISSGHSLMMANSNVTISAWVKQSGGDPYQRVVDKTDAPNGADGYDLYWDVADKEYMLQVNLNKYYHDMSSDGYTYDTWYFLTGVITSTAFHLYVNTEEKSGEWVAGSAAQPPNVQTNMRIGTWNHATGREFKGLIDELRISNTARSVNWINLSYLIVNNQSQYVSFGNEISLINTCQNLTSANTIYYLSQNVSSLGTCFNILADNITLDCQGYIINYSTDGTVGYGVYSNQNLSVVKNAIITEGSSSGSYKHAIYFDAADNGAIQNNTIRTATGSSRAIYLASASRNNSILANNISGSAEWPIYLSSSDSNIIRNNFVNETAGQGSGMYISGSANITIDNNTVIATGWTGRGINLAWSTGANLTNNKVNSSGAISYMIEAYSLSQCNHSIDSSNLAEGSPVNFTKYASNALYDGVDYSSYGEVIFACSSNITLKGSTFGKDTLHLAFVNLSTFEDNIINTALGYGLVITSSSYNTFRNISINNSGAYGIELTYDSSYNNFTNVSIITDSKGIQFFTSNSNIFSELYINTTAWEAIDWGSADNITIYSATIRCTHIGLALYSAGGTNTFKNLDIICDYEPIYISSTVNLTVTDSKLNRTSGAHEVYVDSDVNGAAWNFTNVSRGDGSTINVSWNAAANGTLNYGWWLDAYVNDTHGGALANVNVTAWDNNSNQVFTEITNSSGWITRQALQEYWQNSTTSYYYSNYTVNASLNSSVQSQTVNMSTNRVLAYTFDTNPPSISFVPPTDDNSAVINRNWSYVNVSVTDTSNTSAFIDWNNSLVGWWRFNNESGENSTFFKDWSTYGNNGSCSGENCPNYTSSGKLGNALIFDGTDDYISTSNFADNLPNFSVSVWFKSTDTDESGYPAIVAKMTNGGMVSGTGWGLYFHAWNNNVGSLQAEIQTDENNWADSRTTGLYNDGAWHHAVMVVTNGSTVALYIDGSSVGNLNGGGTLGSYSNSLNVTVGRDGDSSSFFNGSIDDVRIFNRALSSEEINASYNAGLYRLYNNFTNLTDGTYNYTAYAQDEAGNVNSTEERTLTVQTMPPTELKHTVTPAGQGGDYNTLDAAIDHLAASHADLVTANVYATIEIDGDWTGVSDTTAVLIDSLTTDATHYIKIYTTAAARHNGKWDDTKYRLSVSNPAIGAIYLRYTNYVWLDGLQISTSDLAGSGNMDVVQTYVTATSEHKFSNSIFKGANSPTYGQNGLYSVATTLKIWNCLFYNFDTTLSGTRVIEAYGTSYIYSTTVIGGYYGVLRNSGTMVCKNVYAGEQGVGGGYYTVSSMTTCASSDTTGSAGLQNISVNTTQFVNVTAGSEDFHLTGTGSALYNVGTDTSGDAAPMNFTTDIDGQTRSGTWDIGADEYVDTTPPSISFVPPTDNDSVVVNRSWSYVNVSVSDASNTSAFIDWNRSLVGWWSFESYNSTGIYDNSTYNNFGTFQGGLSTSNITTGKYGNALSFDGTDDYVTLGDKSAFKIIGNITVSAWVKHNETSTWQTYVSKWNDDTTNLSYIMQLRGDTQQVIFDLSPDGTSGSMVWATSATTLQPDTWYYVVGVYNGSDIRIYINGLLDQNGAENPKSYSSGIYNGTADLKIGAQTNSAEPMNGTIDDVRVFNRVLSPEEINASYNAGLYKLYHNFTDLTEGNYTFRAYAQDTAGTINSTEERTIIVQLTSLTSCQNLTTANTIYTLANNVNSTGTCFRILANNITLDGQGFSINYSTAGNGGYGVLVDNYNDSTIKNLVIYEGSYSSSNLQSGIYLNYSNNSLVFNNTINNTYSGSYSYGVYVWYGASNNISSNRISSYGQDGIEIFASYYSDIADNNITTGSSYGMLVHTYHTTLRQNTVSSIYSGIYLQYEGNITLTENNVTTTNGPSYTIHYWASDIDGFNITFGPDNLAEGKPVNYTFNAQNAVYDGIDFTQFGEVIFGWGNNVTIRNSNFSDDNLVAYGVGNLTISNNQIISNKSDGLIVESIYNANITGNNVTTNCSSCEAYIINYLNSLIFTNNTATTFGDWAYGFYLYYINNGAISSNTITTYGTGSYSIYTYSDLINVSFSNIKINGSYGIRFTGTSANVSLSGLNITTLLTAETISFDSPNYNITLIDSVLSGSGSTNVSIGGSGTGGTFNFTNVTTPTGDPINISLASGANTTVNYGWWLDANITTSGGAALASATVNATDVLGTSNTNTTDAQGLTRMALLEYTRNNTGGANTTYYSNYTVNASKTGYIPNSTQVNLTTNRQISLALNVNLTSCQDLTTANTVYQLSNNVTSTGTCFNITANNVTLDGQGFTINYSTDGTVGYGVYSNQNLSVVKNAIITEGSSSGSSKYGIYFSAANNGTIQNNTIRTTVSSSYAIYLASAAKNNSILGNNITSAADSIYISSSDSNSIRNNLINNTFLQQRGIRVASSTNITIDNNTITASGSTARGILLYYSTGANLTNNNVNSSSGISYMVQASLQSECNHSIDSSNLAEGSPVNFTKYVSNEVYDGADYSSYGEVIFACSFNITLNGSTFGKDTLHLARVNLSTFENNVINTAVGYGLVLVDSRNNTFRNISINNSGAYGMELSSYSLYNNFTNMSITTNSKGIQFFNSDGNTFSEIYINSTSTGSAAIDFGSSNNITIYSATIRASDRGITLNSGGGANTFMNLDIISGDEPIFISNTVNLTVTDSKLNRTTGAHEVYVDSDVYGGIWNFTNVSRSDGSTINVSWNAAANGTLNYGWWLDANVTSGGAALAGAAVNATDSLGTSQINTTGANGLTRIGLLEYTRNNTGGANITYYSNYTVNATKTGYSSNGTQVNMTTNKQVNLDLAGTSLTACGDLTAANTTYILNNNVNSSGTCFNILANNITLDGQGFTINFSTSAAGYSINITGNNSLVENLVIIEGSTANSQSSAVRVAGQNATVLNTSITTISYSSDGVYLTENSTLLQNLTINVTGQYGDGVFVENSANHRFINNTIFSSMTNGFYLSSATNITLSGNNVTTPDDVGYFIDGTTASHYNHTIDSSNLAEGLPVLYNFSMQDVEVLSNQNLSTTYGQVICGWCTNASYHNISIQNDGISLYNTTNCSVIEASIFTTNGNGVTLSRSSDGLMQGNTINVNNQFSAGVYSTSSQRTMIRDSSFTNQQGYGIFITSDTNSTITNNTITSSQYGAWAIELYGSFVSGPAANIKISNTTIINGSGLIIGGTTTLTLESCSILTHFEPISASWCIFNMSATDTVLNDSTNSVPDIGIDSTCSVLNINLTNVTTSDSTPLNISWGAGVNGTVNYGWWLDANITSGGAALASATVNATDTLGTIQTNTTDANGLTRLALLEYTRNNTGGANITYYSNYTVNASKAGYIPNSTLVNMTNNQQINLVLEKQTELTECGNLTAPNTIYTLSNNVTSTGTCFNITANNVTLDGQGYTINYSTAGSGYGVLVDHYNDSIIKNLIIYEGSTASSAKHGVFLNYSNNSLVFNNTIATITSSSYGVYASYGGSNNISKNQINFSGNNAAGVYNMFSHYGEISDNNISETSYSGYAYGIYIYAYHLALKRNKVASFDLGIFFPYSENLTLTGNNVTTTNSPSYASLYMGSGSSNYNHTIGPDNLAEGKPVNYTYNAQNAVYDGVDFTQFGEVIFGWGNNLTIRNSNFSDDNLLIYGVRNLTISNNQIITNNSDGPVVQSLYNANITGNNATANCTNCRAYEMYYLSNLTFSNNNATVFGSGADGLYLEGISNSTLSNNTITTTGNSDAYGIQFTGTSTSTNITFTNTTINTQGSSGFGFYFAGTSTNVSLSGLSITTAGTIDTIYLASLTHNISIIDSILNGSGGTNFSIAGSGTGGQFNLTNVTTPAGSPINISFASGANTTVNYGWWLDANVTSSGAPLESATVNATDVLGTSKTNTTDAQGLTRMALLEYTRNNTGGANITYYSNYTVNASKGGYISNSTLVNLTTNKQISLELNVNLTSCQDLTAANTVYQLSNNVSSTGTCFNITANNVTLDCNGYTINYSTAGIAGYGINNSGHNYTTIKNCIIYEGNSTTNAKHAIYFANAIGANITNNTISTIGLTSRGIYFYYISSSAIDNNTITTSGNGYGWNSFPMSIELELSPENTISNNSITTTGTRASGIFLYNDASNNSILNNTIKTSNGAGIFLYDNCNLNNISGNWLNTSGKLDVDSATDQAGFSILMDSCSNNNLTSNKAYSNNSNSYLILGKTSLSSYYNHSIDPSNLAEDKPVNYTYNVQNQVYDGIDFTPYGQVIFAWSRNITVKNSNFRDDSLNLFATNASLIQNNNINTSTGFGIFLNRESTNNNISGNMINISCQYCDGIVVNQGGEAVYISNNTINVTGNDASGIYLSCLYTDGSYWYYCGNLKVKNNRLTSASGWGINNVPINSTLDNNTIQVTGGWSGGIRVNGDDLNSNITNNNITAYGEAGMWFTASKVRVINNFINATAWGAYGIRYNYGSNNTFENNTIRTYYGDGIRLDISDWAGYYVERNTFKGMDIQSYGGIPLEIVDAFNGTQFNDSILNSETGALDTYFSDYSNGTIYFYNVTFNKSKANFSTSSIVNLSVNWYLKANVTDTSNSPLNGSNVTIMDKDSTLVYNGLTNTSGLIPRQVLQEYWQNVTANYYYTNYTVNATKTNYNPNSTPVNLTQNKQIVLVLSASNIPPTVDTVSSVSDQTPTADSTTNVQVNFTASDANGVDDLNDSTARAIFTRDGVTREGNCTPNDINSSSTNYNCSVAMMYYDTAGDWTINVTVIDNSQLSAYNATTDFTYQELLYIQVDPVVFGFGDYYPGDSNKAALSNPLLIDNLGNVNLTQINITAYDLVNGSYTLGVSNITVNVSDGAQGTALQDAVPIAIPYANVSADVNGVDANESLYFYISLPPLPPLKYSSSTDWVITADK